MRKMHDHIHHHRGYWSDGGKCRIRTYREEGKLPVVVCSQPPDNRNTSVTNMAEYLAAEVIEGHGLLVPLTWVEHYPEHEGRSGGGPWWRRPGRWRRRAWAGHGGALDSVDVGDAISLVPIVFRPMCR